MSARVATARIIEVVMTSTLVHINADNVMTNGNAVSRKGAPADDAVLGTTPTPGEVGIKDTSATDIFVRAIAKSAVDDTMGAVMVSQRSSTATSVIALSISRACTPMRMLE